MCFADFSPWLKKKIHITAPITLQSGTTPEGATLCPQITLVTVPWLPDSPQCKIAVRGAHDTVSLYPSSAEASVGSKCDPHCCIPPCPWNITVLCGWVLLVWMKLGGQSMHISVIPSTYQAKGTLKERMEGGNSSSWIHPSAVHLGPNVLHGFVDLLTSLFLLEVTTLEYWLRSH